ncbi:hypothetical protein EVAR_70561_1 [Eumeta japonica]|uniref:Uncharacterized protein n=1 Tax=Eumeta variegata TaxID=151549 RepID=A0A4C2AEQ1_EUMVA|nr:hypothetical protein EVAR_70561_1 [Eumeta japonica]
MANATRTYEFGFDVEGRLGTSALTVFGTSDSDFRAFRALRGRGERPLRVNGHSRLLTCDVAHLAFVRVVFLNRRRPSSTEAQWCTTRFQVRIVRSSIVDHVPLLIDIMETKYLLPLRGKRDPEGPLTHALVKNILLKSLADMGYESPEGDLDKFNSSRFQSPAKGKNKRRVSSSSSEEETTGSDSTVAGSENESGSGSESGQSTSKSDASFTLGFPVQPCTAYVDATVPLVVGAGNFAEDRRDKAHLWKSFKVSAFRYKGQSWSNRGGSGQCHRCQRYGYAAKIVTRILERRENTRPSRAAQGLIQNDANFPELRAKPSRNATFAFRPALAPATNPWGRTQPPRAVQELPRESSNALSPA